MASVGNQNPAATISGVRMLDETILRLGAVGDCWNMTWAADDRQYTALCDGYGWFGMPMPTYFSSRMYAVSGAPPNPTFEYLPGYPLLPCTLLGDEHRFAYYGFGTLSVDGRIHQFLSTRNLPEEPRFTGAKLIYSDDNGKTWHNQDGSTPVVWETWEQRSRENLVFFREPGETFNMPTILQMGKDYAANTDGYAYIYSPDGNDLDTMRQLVMCRVPKDKVLDRGAYEFYAGAGADGAPVWSPDIEAREPVHTFPHGWVLPRHWSKDNAFALALGREAEHQPHSWHPSIVYNEPLGIYMMANFGMGVTEGETWFEKPSYLGIWVAEQPWGPWRQIHEDTAWTPGADEPARCYEAVISPKWIAADGRSFWLAWTDYQSPGDLDEAEFSERAWTALREGRYEDAARIESISQPYYGLNVQQVEILF